MLVLARIGKGFWAGFGFQFGSPLREDGPRLPMGCFLVMRVIFLYVYLGSRGSA